LGRAPLLLWNKRGDDAVAASAAAATFLSFLILRGEFPTELNLANKFSGFSVLRTVCINVFGLFFSEVLVVLGVKTFVSARGGVMPCAPAGVGITLIGEGSLLP
jgi:hypothetical protein